MMNTPSRLAIPFSMAILLLAGCGGESDTPAAPLIPATELAAVRTPPPAYPPEAECAGTGGTTVLRVTVSANGVPANVAMAQSSGLDAMDQAAIAAVQQWEFKAATRNGQPVTHTITVPVNFPATEERPVRCFAEDEKR